MSWLHKFFKPNWKVLRNYLVVTRMHNEKQNKHKRNKRERENRACATPSIEMYGNLIMHFYFTEEFS